MKLPKVILALLVLAAAITAAAPAMAASKNGSEAPGFLSNAISETINMTLSGSSGMKITIRHSFGNIEISRGSEDKISITGNKLVASRDDELAQRFLSAMELRVTESNGNVTIETHYPNKDLSKREQSKIKNFSISYAILIPPDVVMDVNNSYGDVAVDKVSGNFSITNAFGKLNVTDLDGTAELNNKFGALNAEIIGGDLIANNEHGLLVISNVAGDLTAKTSFGSAKVTHIKGEAKITNTHGPILAEDIGDRADITTSFAPLSCDTVQGPAVLSNSHGPVSVHNARQDAAITTGFAKAEANNILGNVSVNNQHGSVSIENIGGNASVNSSFGPTYLKRIVGNVSVTNQHSSITAQDLLPPSGDIGRTVSLKTTHGTIKLTVPEKISAQVNASASFGKFKCDFPLLVNLQGVNLSSGSTQKVNGTIGSGNDIIELEGSHGNVYLEKSPSGAWNIKDYISLSDIR